MMNKIVKFLAYSALSVALLLVIALAIFMLIDVAKGIIEIWPI